MARRSSGRDRLWLVLLYVALLAVWALLAYDTYGAWFRRQQSMASVLAGADLSAPDLPSGAGPSAPTPEPTATRPAIIPTVIPTPTVAPPARATATPSSVAVIHPKTGRSIAAWMPTAFDADQARASFEATKGLIDEVSPYWYTASPADGSLVVAPGGRDRSLIESAQAADVLVIPTIHNVYNPDQILPLFRDPARRQAHIGYILDEIRTYGFDGIDVDYEALPPDAREAYGAFMTELSAALHAEGKLLTVAVHAKTGDVDGAVAFQDWALLGQICDRVRVMTYDFHWQGSEPGPIAPLGWVKDVAEYARSVLPSAKIQLGIPFYAYDWAAGENARSVTWTEVQVLIAEHQPVVNLQELDQAGPVEEAWFTYVVDGRTHTVWFASSRALEAKLDLIEDQDLGGMAIWRLGNEDPRNWEVIRERSVEHPAVIQQIFDTYLPEH